MLLASPGFNIILAAVLVGSLIAFFFLRRKLALRRIRTYTGGIIPETMDFGVVFFGYSTDTGRLKPRKGALFATSENLVFMRSGCRIEIVEMLWTRLAGWSVIGQFRDRPLEHEILALTLIGDTGVTRSVAFALPRPEFWTNLISVALRSKGMIEHQDA